MSRHCCTHKRAARSRVRVDEALTMPVPRAWTEADHADVMAPVTARMTSRSPPLACAARWEWVRGAQGEVRSLRWCRRARAHACELDVLTHLLTPCALSAPTTCWAPTMRREDGRSPLVGRALPARAGGYLARTGERRSSCGSQHEQRAQAAARARFARESQRAPGRRRTGALPRERVSSPPAHRAAPTATGAWIARRRPVATREGDRFEGRIRLRYDITNQIERHRGLACHDVYPCVCVAHYQ